MSILVIGEKPSVSRELAKVLGAKNKKNGYMEGNGYIVSWCFGHLVGLKFPDEYSENWAAKWSFSQLPMIPNEWKFKISESSKDQFKVLKELMTNGDITEIICATDADREGECIFRYVYNLVKCRKPVKRLWISSLEESAIRDGFNKLKNSSEYDNLYQAGFCRAKADWLVGMNGSRLFSVRYNAHLNTGRVQTPTLAMIVKRDDDIANFVKQKYFTVDLDIGFKAGSARIDIESNADKLVADCNGKTVTVIEVKKEVKSVSASKLFDLTSLQREANKKFGYTAQQTLDYMQSLYEKKLVTYPRTDSQYLSDDMEQTTYSLIPAISEHFEFGRVENPNLKAVINSGKVTGHHAIIPTESGVKCDISSLSTGEQNILKLVALRLLCASASAYKYGSVKVKLICQNMEFVATGRTVLESGWKALDSKIGEAEKSDEKSLPNLENGMTFTAKASKSEHFTSPPKAYTEDTLLSAMEHAGAEDFDENADKKGLGTPATRANTIENLVKHGYIERDGKKIISTKKKKFAAELPSWQNVPEQPVTASELIRQQQTILRKNAENQRIRGELAKWTAEVERLTRELEVAQQKLLIAQTSAKDLQDESTAEIEQSIAQIDAINAKVRDNIAKSSAEQEASTLREQYDSLTDEIEAIRIARRDLLQTADLPLPGLSVEGGRLLYNGKAWDCMSSSEQLRVGTAIVRRLNPKCGFVLLDKLEQMDMQTLREFGQWLKNEGLQAIATRVSTGDECSVIIEDGYIAGSNGTIPVEVSPTEPTEPEAPRWQKGVF